MLLTKEIEVKWNTNNIKHYESLGYSFTKKGEKFIVPIEHIPPKSMISIEIRCDYCNNKFLRKNSDHKKIIEEQVIQKDACSNCSSKKTKETLEYKQDLKLLTTKDNGYWTFKENRLYELEKYLKENGNINSLYSKSKEANVLWRNFARNDHDLIEAVEEIGYDINEVMTKMPIGYYDKFENLESKINLFINKYGKFPTMNEMIAELKIGQLQILKHGGIDEVKKKMNIEESLIDDNGFYNRSSYEYCVAQYLIHNTNIIYSREQHPFPRHEGKFRSDFTLKTAEENEIHVEIWGGIDKNYNETKLKKMELYKKYNITLISIESHIFKNKMDTIQDILKEIFSPYINLKYNNIDPSLLNPPSYLSDADLFDMIISYSNDKTVLPNSNYLKIIGKNNLYKEASKRFGNYHNFGLNFNVNTAKKNHGFWSIENIEKETLKYIIETGGKIDRKYMNDLGFGNLFAQIGRLRGISFKLNFFQKYISQINKFLHEDEIKFINNVANNTGTNIMNKVSNQQIQQAKDILKEIYIYN